MDGYICKISEFEHIESLRKGHLHLKPIQYHIDKTKIYPKQNNGNSFECLLTKGQETLIKQSKPGISKPATDSTLI